MASEARQLEQRFTMAAAIADKNAITRHLNNAGPRVDGDGVWTFRDNSRGKIPTRPIPIKNDEFNIVGWQNFECLDDVGADEDPPEECQHLIPQREFLDGEATMTQFCPNCSQRF